MQGYPVPLRRMFNDLPEYVNRVDAVYTRDDSNIVLFSGELKIKQKMWFNIILIALFLTASFVFI